MHIEHPIGAGNEKFAITCGFKTAKEGEVIKENYFKRLPKIKKLLESLKEEWKKNSWKGGGYIQVAGGAWVWCLSEHALLNYLLMGSEAQLQNEAICWANMRNYKKGYGGKQLGAFHDEMNWEFPEDTLDKGKRLLTKAYGISSDRFGLSVKVTGTAVSGANWLEVH